MSRPCCPSTTRPVWSSWPRGSPTWAGSCVSSGWTAAALTEAGLTVTDVAELTGYPPILGHRVVTLHPKIHGGLLADRSDPEHVAEMEQYGIQAIDLVVSNLYPFSTDPGIELIDIGGPAMVRAAAKNHEHVGVVVDPADYSVVLDELRADGALGAATRRRLARKAFATTSAYDAAIVAWLDEDDADGRAVPRRRSTSTRRAHPLALRYGENPHQRAALYRTDGADPWWDGHDPARRRRALVPQPLRRRRRVAARARPRRPAGLRHHQARQPVRRGGRPTPSPTPTGRPSSATRGSAFGGIVARQPTDRRGHGRRDGRPPRRPTWSSRPATRTAWSTPASASAGTPGCSRPGRRRPTGATCARSPAATSCRTRTTSPRAGTLAGGHEAPSPPQPSGPTPRSPGGSAAT